MHSNGAASGQVLKQLTWLGPGGRKKGPAAPKTTRVPSAKEGIFRPVSNGPVAEHGPRPVCVRAPPRQAPTPGTPTEGGHAAHACVQAESGPRPEAHARCLLYGVWAHIGSALGQDAATTCGAARYAGKCIDAGSVHVAVGTLRRSRQRGYHTDACTEVNIVGAGTTGHARKATTIKYSAVGAGQCTA